MKSIDLVREEDIDKGRYKFDFQVKGGNFKDWTTMIMAPAEDHEEILKATARFRAAGLETRVVRS